MTPRLFVFASTLTWLACAHADAPRPAPAAAAQAAAMVVAPPPLFLIPADVARTGLVATFVVPALERSLGAGVALVKLAAPLPLDPTSVRDMLLAQAGLPVELGKHLDLAAPIAGAVVVAGPGRSPLTAFSFACRTQADVPLMLAALGRTVAQRGAAVQVENASGDRGWFLPQGNIVVLADTDEALVRAGSLALEARRKAEDDLSVSLDPEMVARVAGTDVKTALKRMVSEIEERAAATGSKLGPEGMRQVREMAEYIGDASRVELALSLDAGRGAAFLLRLHAKPGSKLEAVARQTKGATIDPALLQLAMTGKNEAGLAMASTYGVATLEAISRQRAKLPSGGGKAVDAAGRFMDALVDGLTGTLAMIGRVQPAVSGELSYATRDAASAARIRATLAGSSKESIAALMTAVTQGEGLGLKVLKARPEAAGKARALHITLAVTVPGDSKAALRKLIGPAGLDVFMAVIGDDRLVMTMGQGAKARMAALAAVPKKGVLVPTATTGSLAAATTTNPAKTSALAEAIALMSGRSLFYFFDLRQAVTAAVAVMNEPRFRAFEGAMKSPIPFVGGITGSAQGSLTLDLTISASSFAGMGALVQAAMMMRN